MKSSLYFFFMSSFITSSSSSLSLLVSSSFLVATTECFSPPSLKKISIATTKTSTAAAAGRRRYHYHHPNGRRTFQLLSFSNRQEQEEHNKHNKRLFHRMVTKSSATLPPILTKMTAKPTTTALRMSSSTTDSTSSSSSTTTTKTTIASNDDKNQKNLSKEEQLIQDMLSRIRQINYMPEEIKSTLLDFKVDGVVLGKVRPSIAEMLCNIPYNNNNNNDNNKSDNNDSSVFICKIDSENNNKTYLTLSEQLAGTTIESRTKAVATVTEQLKNNGFVTGWRNELFAVTSTFYDSEPKFLMERSAMDVLGLMDYGVHINGLVRQQPQSQTQTEQQLPPPPKMWIGRRSKTKSKFPGMLDHLVAGGQPAGLSLMENVLKECEEEAGIPSELVQAGIHPVGAISYSSWNPKTDKISRVVLFNYDLYLPETFIPKPVDGEVEEFFLWSIDDVKHSIYLDYQDPIKPNCYVVIIDYLLRQGYISPEINGYLDVLKELRSGDCQ